MLIVYKNKLNHFVVCNCNHIFALKKSGIDRVSTLTIQTQLAHGQTITLWIIGYLDVNCSAAPGSTGASCDHCQSHNEAIVHGGV